MAGDLNWTTLGQFDAALVRLLRKEEILAEEELDEALTEQVICGGSLSATLWELGLLSIKELNELGARLHRKQPVHYDDLVHVPRDLIALFSREFISKVRVVPVRKEGTTLFVATDEPWRLDVLDEASFRSGMTVNFLYLNEVSLALFMEVFYSLPAKPRFKIRPMERKRRQRKSVVADEKKPGPEEFEELMRPEDFSKLYQDIERAPDSASLPFQPASLSSGVEGFGSAATDPLMQLVQQVLAKVVQPGEALNALAPVPPVEAPPPPVPPAAEPVATTPAAPVVEPVPPNAPPAAPRKLEKPPEIDLVEEALVEPPAALPKRLERALTPISDLQEALRAIDASANREGLGEVVTRFALSKGRRTLLFTCKGDRWMGWTGGGMNVRREWAASLMVPSKPGTFFGLVAKTGAHYMGPIIDHPIHRSFFKSLGPPLPKTIGFFPVHYKGRIVFGIYLDGGDDLSQGVAEILLMAQRVAMALERLVRSRNGE